MKNMMIIASACVALNTTVFSMEENGEDANFQRAIEESLKENINPILSEQEELDIIIALSLEENQKKIQQEEEEKEKLSIARQKSLEEFYNTLKAQEMVKEEIKIEENNVKPQELNIEEKEETEDDEIEEAKKLSIQLNTKIEQINEDKETEDDEIEEAKKLSIQLNTKIEQINEDKEPTAEAIKEELQKNVQSIFLLKRLGLLKEDIEKSPEKTDIEQIKKLKTQYNTAIKKLALILQEAYSDLSVERCEELVTKCFDHNDNHKN